VCFLPKRSITLFEYWSQHHEEVGACSLHNKIGVSPSSLRQESPGRYDLRQQASSQRIAATTSTSLEVLLSQRSSARKLVDEDHIVRGILGEENLETTDSQFLVKLIDYAGQLHLFTIKSVFLQVLFAKTTKR
jgi:hypothetical protein